ncbi:conserved hypothetical protein, partial [Leishmania braziliensis MHOM/BR/75/M2904]
FQENDTAPLQLLVGRWCATPWCNSSAIKPNFSPLWWWIKVSTLWCKATAVLTLGSSSGSTPPLKKRTWNALGLWGAFCGTQRNGKWTTGPQISKMRRRLLPPSVRQRYARMAFPWRLRMRNTSLTKRSSPSITKHAPGLILCNFSRNFTASMAAVYGWRSFAVTSDENPSWCIL